MLLISFLLESQFVCQQLQEKRCIQGYLSLGEEQRTLSPLGRNDIDETTTDIDAGPAAVDAAAVMETYYQL